MAAIHPNQFGDFIRYCLFYVIFGSVFELFIGNLSFDKRALPVAV